MPVDIAQILKDEIECDSWLDQTSGTHYEIPQYNLRFPELIRIAVDADTEIPCELRVVATIDGYYDRARTTSEVEFIAKLDSQVLVDGKLSLVYAVRY